MSKNPNYTSCVIICVTCLVAISLLVDLEKLKLSRDRLLNDKGQEDVRKRQENIDEEILETVIHDHHWFVLVKSHNSVIHHPDCPCLNKQD